MKFICLFSFILFIASCSSVKKENEALKLNEEEMVLAVERINKFTQQRNLDEATKYYFSGTRFYQYQNLAGNQTSTSQSYEEAITGFKVMFKTKAIKLIESKKISEEIKFNDQGLGSVLTVYNRTYISLGKKITAPETYIRIFGFHEGKMVILEEHLL